MSLDEVRGGVELDETRNDMDSTLVEDGDDLDGDDVVGADEPPDG